MGAHSTHVPLGEPLSLYQAVLTDVRFKLSFVDRYDFVFVRSLNGRAASRREVRIVLHGVIVQSLPKGDYDLALFAWSTERMGFVAPTVVRVTVK